MSKDNWHFDKKPETEITWKEEERDETAPYVSMNCIEIKGDESPKEISVDVVVEEMFGIFLNDNYISSFLGSPRELEEMTAGHLISEGYIENADDISSIEIDNNKLFCKTKKLTKCTADPDPNLRVQKDTIFDLIDHIFEEGKIWRRTGGAHSTIIASQDGEILAFCEDVSRASAVDKAIGKAALEGVKLHKCIMATSGRLSVTMVGKAVNAKVPVIVSKAAPMDQGIRLAQANNVTLVGFARRPNLYIYSNPERILI